MGYDAGLLLAGAIRGGSTTRTELRNSMSATTWHRGASGTFRFGPLGRRVDKRESVATKESSTRVSMRRIPAEE